MNDDKPVEQPAPAPQKSPPVIHGRRPYLVASEKYPLDPGGCVTVRIHSEVEFRTIHWVDIEASGAPWVLEVHNYDRLEFKALSALRRAHSSVAPNRIYLCGSDHHPLPAEDDEDGPGVDCGGMYLVVRPGQTATITLNNADAPGQPSKEFQFIVGGEATS